MFKKKDQLKTGVILSYINLGLSCIIPFIYTPVMLRLLGQSEYGLYSLANSVISYLTLLSFGFGSTIVRYLSKYRAENNRDAVQRTFGLFLILYSIAGFFVLLIGFIISYNVEPIFHKGLTENEINKIFILIIIMTINTAVSFPISVFSSVITSYERYIFRKIVDMLSTVIAPLFNLIALYLGFASIGMAVASTIIQIIMLPINVGYCTKKLRILPKFGKIDRSLLNEMLRFSFYSFIGTLVDLLFWSTDKVILGMLSGSIAVAIYNIGSTFNTIIIGLSSSISNVLTPRITYLVSQNVAKQSLSNLFIKVGRLQFLIVGLAISGFVVFGQSFISMWAGTEYYKAYWIAILTLVPLCIPLIQNTGLSIVIAQNKHSFRSKTYLIIALVNVLSTYWIVPYYGEIGAALCSGISYIIGQGIIMNIYYYKIIGLDIIRFWKNIAKMSIIPIILTFLGTYFNWIYEIRNWQSFFFFVLVYIMMYCCMSYKFTLNNYEKEMIVLPIRRLYNVFFKKN